MTTLRQVWQESGLTPRQAVQIILWLVVVGGVGVALLWSGVYDILYACGVEGACG